MERLFRAESARIVASLTRRLGASRLDLAQDVVQDAMVQALRHWPFSGVPDDPAAWLRRVALNRAIDLLRRRTRVDRHAATLARSIERDLLAHRPDTIVPGGLADDELRMVMLCCHPALARGARVALSLKVVSGFSVGEIARALLSTERAVAQRLVRAKRQLRALRVSFALPGTAKLSARVDAALDVVYLLFNEGYSAHAGENLVRADLCAEAMRLGRLIAGTRMVASPRAHALMALMCFQAARLPARVNQRGEFVRLDDQDRSRWDGSLLRAGFAHLDHSMQGDEESTFHLQAAIAATHATATEPAATDWVTILSLYDRLQAIDRSPVVRLNRAVAVARVHGADAGLAVLEPLTRLATMRSYFLLPAVRAALLAEAGRLVEARCAYQEAHALGGSLPERSFIESQLARLARPCTAADAE